MGLQHYMPSDAREVVEAHEMRPVPEWMDHAEFTLDGVKCDFERVPYLREIYADEHPQLVFEKGSQTGASFYAVARMMRDCDYGRTSIYYFPTDKEVKKFVQARIKKCIKGSKYLMGRVGDVDNLDEIDLGRGMMIFRGLYDGLAAKSQPAQELYFDEVDEANPYNLLLAEDRVLMADNPVKVHLSVPSFSDDGIDKLFLASDQRYYLVKCESCNEWANVDKDYPANFLPVAKLQQKSLPDGMTHYRGCRHCGTRLNMANGTWVPTCRDRDVHGYHMSRLINSIHPAEFPNAATYLVREERRHQGTIRGRKRWNIAFRGLPFDGEGAEITDARLKSMEQDYGFLYKASGTIMGVDSGDNKHVSVYHRVGNAMQLIFCIVVQSWADVAALFEQFGCYVACVDGKPERTPAKEFAAKFPKRVYVHDFGPDQYDESQPGRPRKVRFLQSGRISVPWITSDRTETLDTVTSFVLRPRLILPSRERLKGRDLQEYEEYRRNLIHLRWKWVEKESGEKERKYLKNNNHHGMGLLYAYLAAFECGHRGPSTGPQVYFAGEEGHA